MEDFEKLLLENKAWAREQKENDPEFFTRLAEQQTPKFLWIGCSDSRVPADKITGTDPGAIFVHRNIANLVVNTDINMLSVLQYSVEVLKVEHVIVCGHYGCGGVKAALGNHHFGIINHWLNEIKDVYRSNKADIDKLKTEEEKTNKLVELNVQEQVFNLSKTDIIQNAWKQNKMPMLHGWVYGLNNGILKPIVKQGAEDGANPIYAFDNL